MANTIPQGNPLVILALPLIVFLVLSPAPQILRVSGLLRHFGLKVTENWWTKKCPVPPKALRCCHQELNVNHLVQQFCPSYSCHTRLFLVSQRVFVSQSQGCYTPPHNNNNVSL